MKFCSYLLHTIGLVLSALVLSACGSDAPSNNSDAETPRIISLGGEISETLVELGLESQLVAVDSTSLYPSRLSELPNIGYLRQLNTEAVAALAPDLIIASHDAGPDHVLAQWRRLGIQVEQITTGPNIDLALSAVEQIGELVGRADQARAIVERNRTELAAMTAAVDARDQEPPRVLFVLTNAGNQPLIAGRGSKADVMINAAGGLNVAANIQGYKPGSAEAIAAMAPDAVLVARHGLPSFGGADRLAEHPALRHTPAAQAGKISVVDSGLVLNLGPRLAEGVRLLHRELWEQGIERQANVQ